MRIDAAWRHWIENPLVENIPFIHDTVGSIPYYNEWSQWRLRSGKSEVGLICKSGNFPAERNNKMIGRVGASANKPEDTPQWMHFRMLE